VLAFASGIYEIESPGEFSRREGNAFMNCKKYLGLVALAAGISLKASAQQVFVEAESFDDLGGWTLDTQFIEIMGSPYLLAHGLGEPVTDAVTTVKFPETGAYRVWVRTKDWVARWKAEGAPGKFQLVVAGEPLKEIFGTKGEEWFWQDGGNVEIKSKETKIALHDLSGFEGRCDAILFSKDPKYTPPNDSTPLADWRKKLLGLPSEPVDDGSYDLVVCGGGIAGTATAISAARNGCKVALIQDRPVLGGNGSSEIRVWPMGLTRRGAYPRLGEIVETLCDKPTTSPGHASEWHDDKRENAVRAEKNISLFLNHHVIAVDLAGAKIASVRALDTRTGAEKKFAGKYFCDSTGHGTVGFLAGAYHTTQTEGHMGMSNMWNWKDTDEPQIFPQTPWALDLEMGDFPYPRKGHGEWFWETGFNKDPIKDLELMRDWNFRAVYGAFNAMKNKEGAAQHQKAKLEWIAAIGGTRESRQILGDVVLTKDDIVGKREFPDGCVPTTWDIDIHYPKPEFAKKYTNDQFISYAQFGKGVDKKEGYPVPYRCFYSTNVPNLFIASRCMSVTHEALGTVRVQKTLGMAGEVVGKAVAICIKEDCGPRDVYEKHLAELKTLMSQPGVMRRDTLDGKFYVPAGEKVPDLPKPVETAEKAVKYFDPAKMKGIVIDDEQAKLSGSWSSAAGLENFIGVGYRYISGKTKGAAKFEFTVPANGKYEVLFAYQPHENRAAKLPVSIFSAEGVNTVEVNEKSAPPVAPTFVSLGKFDFETDKPGVVVVTSDGTISGNIGIDAVQVVPAGN
jgi:hypothetical protein